MNSEKNLKDNKKKRKPFYNFCYDFVKVTGAIPAMVWLRPKVYRPYGTKVPKGKVLISANHTTLIDPIIVHLAVKSRRLDCLATKDLYSSKLKSAFFSRMHCIMVDKENFTLSAFHDVVSRLNDGKAVVIFPEGSVNLGGEESIRAFKSGAVLMAHKANAPILPLYIVKNEKWYHRQRIIMGEPFSVTDAVGSMPTLEQLNAASEMLREREVELRRYYESLPIYKKISRKYNKKTSVEEEINK